ncbi:hypothetical protein F5Y06DRAFT_46689 [Hypoxylon sp. FL0890]|nr:hypothetical protein F5Y06DRAFT_46689 [Hypoxylon sp. FL0890]
MEVFPYFDALPTELQIMIWKLAIHHEACFRLVFLHRRQVLPRSYLCSPFLSVNRQSRHFALRFYRVKLSVSPLRLDPGGSSAPRRLLPPLPRREDPTDGTSGTVRRRTAPYHGPGFGCIYVSPEFDTFMFDWSFFDHLWPDRRSYRPTQISADLPYSACADIRNLIRVTRPYYNNARSLTPEAVATVWHTDIFTGFHPFQTCHLGLGSTLLEILPWLVGYLWQTGDFMMTDETQPWEWIDKPITERPRNSQPAFTELETQLQQIPKNGRRSRISAIIMILDRRLNLTNSEFQKIARKASFGPSLVSALSMLVLERERRYRELAATSRPSWRRALPPLQ